MWWHLTPARFLPLLLAAVACTSAEPPDDSPRRIAYVDVRQVPGGGTDVQLAIVNQDGTGYVQLATGVRDTPSPATAPDGHAIIYQGFAPNEYGVAWYSVSPDGGAPLDLQMPSSVFSPLWSPNSRRVAWINYENVSHLAVSAAGSSTVTNLTPDTVFVDPDATWAPDNSRLAALRRVNDQNGPNWDLFTVTITGVLRPLVVSPGIYDGPPAWSPDGRTIAYTQPYTGDPASGIYLVNPDGTNQRQLVRGYFDGFMSWSPDGKTIAFWGYRTGGGAPGLSLIDVASGEAGPALSLPNYAFPAQRPWSRDGSLFLLTAQAPSGTAIYTLDRSGVLTQVTPDSISAQTPSWVE